MRPPLKDHQREDIAWIQKARRGLLANEPGVGKSRSAIEATAGMRTLIVAPNLVLNGGNWDDELARWADEPGMYAQASYSSLNQRQKTEQGGTRPVNRLREEWQERFDAVIIDEAHYVKGRKTSWTWAVQKIAATADLVIPMTGTPIPNWAHELFTLLQLIYPEDAGRGGVYGSFWRWAEQWFDTTPTRFSNGNPVVGELKGCMLANRGGLECLERPADNPCEHYHRFTRENLGNQYRRVLRKDCLDLPELTEQVVKVPMSAGQKKIYRGLRDDFNATISGTEVVAWSQGAKNVLLDKCTTSPWLLAPEGEPRGGKLDLLRFDLESRQVPTLVLAHYRDSVRACARVAELAGHRAGYISGETSSKSDAAAIRDFKAGRLPVLVGSLETLAEGLTLTAADMAIFVEMSYKPSRNVQARYRVHRMGQTRPVTVLEYVTPGTVDERKRRLLATKTDRQMRTLTAAQFADLI